MGHKANWKLPPFEKTEEWNDLYKKWRQAYNTCDNCDSTDTEVRNYDPVWRDGDVMCNNCGGYVRGYDAG